MIMKKKHSVTRCVVSKNETIFLQGARSTVKILSGIEVIEVFAYSREFSLSLLLVLQLQHTTLVIGLINSQISTLEIKSTRTHIGTSFDSPILENITA
jgi:hypothetical protein